MNFVEIANKQKQKPLIYLFIFILISIFLFISISIIASIIAQNRESTLPITKWLLYLLIMAFISGTTFFFCWNLTKDLNTSFTEEGIETKLFKRNCLKWIEVNGVKIKKSGAIIIESNQQEIRINPLFYKNPSILFQLFKEKLGDNIIIENTVLK
jgi:hypothetical protein